MSPGQNPTNIWNSYTIYITKIGLHENCVHALGAYIQHQWKVFGISTNHVKTQCFLQVQLQKYCKFIQNSWEILSIPLQHVIIYRFLIIFWETQEVILQILYAQLGIRRTLQTVWYLAKYI